MVPPKIGRKIHVFLKLHNLEKFIEPEKRLKTADELYQKTKTQPAIYFLPLTDDQVSEIYLFLWEMKLVRLYLQIC